MSLPDEPMRQYFTLLTDIPLAEVDRLLAPGVNPRDAKEALGKAIVAQYSGAEAADRAADEFRRRSREFDLNAVAEPRAAVNPDQDLDEGGCILPGKLLQIVGLASSASEGSRLVVQGGVWIGADQHPLERDRSKPLKVEDGEIIGVGKGNKARACRIRVAGRQ
jgi:tyrosyl-tRNA synthetase